MSGQQQPPLPLFSAPPPPSSAPKSTQQLFAIDLEDPIFEFDKLTNTNWIAWRMHMSIVLRRMRIEDIALGQTPQPQDVIAAEDWHAKDDFAQELIICNISDKQLVHISGCQTSAQMWETLRTINELNTALNNKRFLYGTQAREHTDIPRHLKKLCTARKALAIVGHPIDDADFKEILVASLPESWTSSGLVTLGTSTAFAAHLMTVGALISILEREYERRREKSKRAEYVCAATRAAKKKKHPCKICGRTNHITAACRCKGKGKCAVK